MTREDRILPAVALLIGFSVVAPLTDIAAKFAALSPWLVPVGIITLGRYVVQGGLMLPVLLAMGLSLRLAPRDLGPLIARSGVSILSTYSFIAAFRVMPLADALAIAFVEPFILLMIGRYVMGEQVGPRRLAACATGFLGALLVIQPSFATFGPVALWPLVTAVSFALYMLITRHLSRRVHPVAMQVHTSWIAALLCLPLLAIGHALGEPSMSFVLPQGWAWGLIFCVGLAATVSHMAMTFALRLAPSSTLAPLRYLEVLFAVAFSYLFFGDFPNGLTWTGIAIITASGIYIIYREQVVARAGWAAARAARQAMPGAEV